MMALITCITHGEQRLAGDLSLNGEHVVLRVGDAVAVVEKWIPADRDHGVEVESGIRMLGGYVIRREGKRERVGILRSVSGVGKWCREQRRRGAQVVISVGRHAVHNSGAESGKRGVEDAVAGADAAFSGIAKDLPEKFIFEVWRIGQADPRGEVAILGCG